MFAIVFSNILTTQKVSQIFIGLDCNYISFYLFVDVHFHINQNLRRLREEGLCRWPSKKLIEMPQFASKMYTPRKYVIYQCSDDTACCGSYDKTCVAKKSEEVVLWFHVRFVSQAR